MGIFDAICTQMQIESGVPQSTLLDPLLFNLYINDWFRLSSECGYADDTAIF